MTEEQIQKLSEDKAIEAGYIQSDKEYFETTHWTQHNIYKDGVIEGYKAALKNKSDVEELNYYGWAKDGMKENPKNIPPEDVFILRSDVIDLQNKVSDEEKQARRIDLLEPINTIKDLLYEYGKHFNNFYKSGNPYPGFSGNTDIECVDEFLDGIKDEPFFKQENKVSDISADTKIEADISEDVEDEYELLLMIKYEIQKAERLISASKCIEAHKNILNLVSIKRKQRVEPIPTVDEDKDEDEFWNKVGAILNGSVSFSMYPKYLATLKQQFSITRK